MFAAELRTVQKAITRLRADLARMADDNIYTLDYLISQPAAKPSTNDTKIPHLLTNGNGHLSAVDKSIDDDDDSSEIDDAWIGLDDDE